MRVCFSEHSSKALCKKTSMQIKTLRSDFRLAYTTVCHLSAKMSEKVSLRYNNTLILT